MQRVCVTCTNAPPAWRGASARYVAFLRGRRCFTFVPPQCAAAIEHFRHAHVDPRRVIALFDGALASDSAFRAPDDDTTLDAVLGGSGASPERTAAMAAAADYMRAARQGALPGVGALAPPVARDVDTALAKLLASSGRDDELRALLTAPHQCNNKDVEIFLVQRRQFQAAGLLYESNGELRKALDVWRKIGTQSEQYRDANGHTGVADTARVLSLDTTPPALVLDYVEWLLPRDAPLCLRVLTARRRPENALAPTVVMDWLAARNAAPLRQQVGAR